MWTTGLQLNYLVRLMYDACFTIPNKMSVVLEFIMRLEIESTSHVDEGKKKECGFLTSTCVHC